ncbi:hypothetical protein ABPG74_013334 [Tetrahymena malaccensis]
MWENKIEHNRKSQHFLSQNHFHEKKENIQQPPFKNYVLGEKTQKPQQINQLDTQEFHQRGTNRQRVFGRVINENGINNNNYFHSQPLQKQFKVFNPFAQDFNLLQNDQNKENMLNFQHNFQSEVHKNPQMKNANQEITKEQVQSEKSFQMIDESEKNDSQQESQLIQNILNLDLLNTSQNMIEQNQNQLTNFCQENDKLKEFHIINETNYNTLKSTQIEKINIFDRQFISNPIYVADYAQEIFEYLQVHQDRYLCKDNVDLKDMHTQINETMRCILIDWLTEVSIKYELKEETIFMCIYMLDIYCRLCYQDGVQILRDHYQKIGVSCLYISSKLEEIYPPGVKEFVKICDGAYKLKDIISTETDICLKLQFNFSFPTPFTFFVRYSKILGHSNLQYYQGLFILYLCFMHSELSPMYVKSSIIASCSCFLVESVAENIWDEKIKSLSSIVYLHPTSDFQFLMPSIHKLIQLYSNPQFPFEAIRKKFSTDSFCKVSTTFSQNIADSQKNSQQSQQQSKI